MHERENARRRKEASEEAGARLHYAYNKFQDCAQELETAEVTLLGFEDSPKSLPAREWRLTQITLRGHVHDARKIEKAARDVLNEAETYCKDLGMPEPDRRAYRFHGALEEIDHKPLWGDENVPTSSRPPTAKN